LPGRLPGLPPSVPSTWKEQPGDVPPDARGDPGDDDPVGEGTLTRETWSLYLQDRLAASDLPVERRRQIAEDAQRLLAPPRHVLGVAHDLYGWRAPALFRLACSVRGGAVLDLDRGPYGVVDRSTAALAESISPAKEGFRCNLLISPHRVLLVKTPYLQRFPPQ
jgi:hypothetical protein